MAASNNTSPSADNEAGATNEDNGALGITFEDLLDELKSPDDHRRNAALIAAHRCKVLVDLRAAANGTTFEQEWSTIFDAAKLQAEMNGSDPKRGAAAFEVLFKVSCVAAVRDADREPTTLKVRVMAMGLRARVTHKLAELRAQAGLATEHEPKN